MKRLLVLASLFVAGSASASPLLGTDAPVEKKCLDLANGYQRQQDVFAASENGLSLDTYVVPGEIPTVQKFFAQTAEPDFEKLTGKKPWDVVDHFDEYGDEGNFAGTASLGVAARLIVLRSSGAPADEVTRARDAAIRAAKAWHVYGAIGGPGVVARGVRKLGGPGAPPTLVALKDASGPLPTKKEASWRAPVAPGFDGWIWFDDTSKDQVIGYALASMWLWDALHDDPMAPKEVSDDLAKDLAAFAHALMTVVPELGVDLCIRDADGRLTTFHDLNDRQLTPDAVVPEDSIVLNGFNAALALAIVRAAYHVSGDPEIGKFYYEELVGKRDYPGEMSKTAGLLFSGVATNYSNVNMLAIALATLGRIETDPYVRERLAATLETQFWSRAGDDRDVQHVHQAWFDAIVGAYGETKHPEIPQRIADDLAGFNPPPAFQRDRVNCDDMEIAAGVCTAIDGSTITLAKAGGHGGGVVARDVVPRAIRPDSDFSWRSDPHSVNGTASNLLDPGGDYLAAYWLARASDRDATLKNRSPFARVALPYTKSDGEGTDAGVNPGAPGDSGSSGCSCELTSTASTAPPLFVLGLLALLRRRRRLRPRASAPTPSS